MKRIWILAMGLLIAVLTGCAANQDTIEEKKLVVVGIAPMKEWVETVAGDSFQVQVMIPPGYSPANYEPTTRQLLSLEEMDLYFAMGVGAETEGFLSRIFPKSDERVIHLYSEVGDVYPDRFMDAHEHNGEEDAEEESEGHLGRDPHIWLSIPRVIFMVERITEELATINPNEAASYQARSEAYIQDLMALDKELRDKFGQASNKSFMLFHPSLGYFADEYGLNMLVIEEGGKSATPTHLIEVIDLAKAEGINTVFYQAEFDENQARTIAQELNGDLVPLSILEEDYLNGMTQIGDALLKAME